MCKQHVGLYIYLLAFTADRHPEGIWAYCSWVHCRYVLRPISKQLSRPVLVRESWRVLSCRKTILGLYRFVAGFNVVNARSMLFLLWEWIANVQLRCMPWSWKFPWAMIRPPLTDKGRQVLRRTGGFLADKSRTLEGRRDLMHPWFQLTPRGTYCVD